jgi:hypothetical protein
MIYNKILAVCLAFLAVTSAVAQDDAMLIELKKGLTEKWEAKRVGESFVLSYVDAVEVANANLREVMADKIALSFTLKFETAWSEVKIATTKENNANNKVERAGLAEKYGIAHLKRRDRYYGSTDEEREKIRACLEEEKTLKGKIVVLPHFTGTTHSIYISDNIPRGMQILKAEIQASFDSTLSDALRVVMNF